MHITIKNEQQKEYREVENLIRDAFWDIYKPGCDEHFIVHKMRDSDCFVKELAYVAYDGISLVGAIFYTKAKIINEQSQNETEVLCMGPIGVLPSNQRKGVGTLLMNHSIEKAAQLGYKSIIIFGDPNYYHRFGFKNAKEYDIQTSWGANFEEFMVLELYKGALNECGGKFYEDSIFSVDKQELEIFDQQFPYREKHITDTQLKDHV